VYYQNTPQTEMPFNLKQYKVYYQNQIPLLCTSSYIDSHPSRQKKCVAVSVATARRQVRHICPWCRLVSCRNIKTFHALQFVSFHNRCHLQIWGHHILITTAHHGAANDRSDMM